MIYKDYTATNNREIGKQFTLPKPKMLAFTEDPVPPLRLGPTAALRVPRSQRLTHRRLFNGLLRNLRPPDTSDNAQQ